MKFVLQRVIHIESVQSITGKQKWIETLFCGHKNTVYGESKPTAKKRRCLHLDCVSAPESGDVK